MANSLEMFLQGGQACTHRVDGDMRSTRVSPPLRLEIHEVKRYRAHREADLRRIEDTHHSQEEAAVLQARLEQFIRRKCCQLLRCKVEVMMRSGFCSGIHHPRSLLAFSFDQQIIIKSTRFPLA